MSWALRRAAAYLRRGNVPDALRLLAWAGVEWRHERRMGIRSSGSSDASAFSDNPSECSEYEPSSYTVLARLFQRIGPRRAEEGQVLLDAGCGLGRAMIFAAAWPYAQVLGFDISPDLVAQAQHNIRRTRAPLACPRILPEVASAADYRVPDAVTTVFCYNPFRGSIMDAFLGQVRASLERRPRPLTVAFVNPRYIALDQYPWLARVDGFEVFDPRTGSDLNHRQQVAILRNCS